MELWYSMLMGGTGRGLVEAALVICLFWAALSRPERIRNLFEFRLASVLLGISIIAPALIQMFFMGFTGTAALNRPGAGKQPEALMFTMAIPPLLTMLAVLLGIDAVTPRGIAANTTSRTPEEMERP